MDKRRERLTLLALDFVAVNIAFFCYFVLRVNTKWFDLLILPDFWAPMLVICFYWLLVFLFVGLYRSWFALSRFDEISTLFKATFVGIFVLFFLVFIDDANHGVASGSRILIVLYWALIFCFDSFFRLSFRAIQRSLLIKGVGCKNTLIIGTGDYAKKIYSEITRHPGLGLRVVGFLEIDDEKTEILVDGNLIVGKIEDFESVLEHYTIKEVVFALEKQHDDFVVDLIARSEGKDLGLKIVPTLYEILSGQARTTQLYGVPLIDINPTIMPEWELKAKRLMDLGAAVLILIVSSPAIIIAAIAIKINSKGPVFYLQERSGLNGKPFRIVKFRSMRQDAEQATGPVWSQKDDPRITEVGKFIRRVRIDEIPQMWNVLKGEMSLIGPRPERPYFVEKLSEEIPYYKRRLRVRPGVTGWAQVKHKYDENIDDVREKVRFDLFYIENMSLRMDFKIMLRTVLVVLFGKGHYE